MIYAFDFDSEPVMEDYDFSIKMEKLKTEDNGLISTSLTVVNQKESDRYDSDIAIYVKKAKKGRQYFALYFNSLWT